MGTSAKTKTTALSRICQCDLFKNIELIEKIDITKDALSVKKISFPCVIVLNQECDLCRFFENKESGNLRKETSLLHLTVAPVFNFESFLAGSHWGNIFDSEKARKRKDTEVKKIMENDISRYHYLCFDEREKMPEMIIDFKHFFSVNIDYLCEHISDRICSLDDLYKEKISQRFAYFISRIGLP